jgi:Aerotolerance regulator N-terminal
MFPVFVYPLAFLGLLTLPALVAIYYFRSRHRRQVVSSLMLWLDPRETRSGGTVIRRLQTPLLFFLELLLLALLTLAAAGPHVRSSEGTRPLVVVLDDSFSMLAGGDDCARNRAVRALKEEFQRRGSGPVRLVLAGERPVLLGEPVGTAPELAHLLKQWECRSPAASLEAGLAVASEIGGDLALLLVLTDRSSGEELEKGRVEWWSFGEPRPNLALVNAARTNRDGADRCLLEVANLSATTESTTLVITTGEQEAEVRRSVLSLKPGETHRTVLQLPSGTTALQARIGDDVLAIDNRVNLLPIGRREVRVEVRVDSPVLRPLVEKAVRAAGGMLIEDPTPRPPLRFGEGEKDRREEKSGPRSDPPTAPPRNGEGGRDKKDKGGGRVQIIITDSESVPDTEPGTWVLQLLAEKQAEAFLGPFVLDRAHPLTEGLSMQGVIWGAGKTTSFPGRPVVMAGNVPLLTDAEDAAGRHTLRLRLRPDLSTLQDSPNWPILLANLVQWQSSGQPGLARPNLRLGEEAVLTFVVPPEEVIWTAPDGTTRTLVVQDRRVVARPELVGVHRLKAGEEETPFACNALAREESDLRKCASGRWGDWLDETTLRLEYRSIAWVFLLGALLVASLHMALVAHDRAGRRP